MRNILLTICFYEITHDIEMKLNTVPPTLLCCVKKSQRRHFYSATIATTAFRALGDGYAAKPGKSLLRGSNPGRWLYKETLTTKPPRLQTFAYRGHHYINF